MLLILSPKRVLEQQQQQSPLGIILQTYTHVECIGYEIELTTFTLKQIFVKSIGPAVKGIGLEREVLGSQNYYYI